jgi:CRISPR-associated protein Cas1
MKTKTVKIALEGFGSYLCMERGCFIVKDEHGHEDRYSLFENQISEVKIKSGNAISAGALVTCAFWNIDCLFLTGHGRPIGMLRTLDDDSHVQIRIAQYEALSNDKAIQISKLFVLAKFEGENRLLKKYGLKLHDYSLVEKVKSLTAENTTQFRTRLNSVEGHFTANYFSQVFSLIPEPLRPSSRKTFKAYDGINNLFNLAYEMLSWRVQHALIKAKLEPYLGFLHSTKKGRPSLIYDFMELYRYLLDDYVLKFSQKLHRADFITKQEVYADKISKRIYLNDSETAIFMKNLDSLFESKVQFPRMRRGQSQELETLINEEALLFAQYLRNEKQEWFPRIVELNH